MGRAGAVTWPWRGLLRCGVAVAVSRLPACGSGCFSECINLFNRSEVCWDRIVLKIGYERRGLVTASRWGGEIDMSARWVAALGGAVSFVVAVVAGVVGNELRDTSWAWLAFGITLVLGALVTGWTAYRTAKSGSISSHGGPRAGDLKHVGDATVGEVRADGGQATGVNYGTMSQIHRREES